MREEELARIRQSLDLNLVPPSMWGSHYVRYARQLLQEVDRLRAEITKLRNEPRWEGDED